MGFSRREMLREYAGESRRIASLLLGVFAAAVMILWVQYIRSAPHEGKDIYLFSGLSLAAAGLCLGPYWIFTADKWLLSHTPFGQALTALGDAGDSMARIDREAAAGERYENVFLLSGWLILFYQSPTARDRSRVCARPIRAEDLSGIAVSPLEGGGLTIRACMGDKVLAQTQIGEKDEWLALSQWMNAREKEIKWSK